MYINAVTNNAMLHLYLPHYFYNIGYKNIKNIPPTNEKFWMNTRFSDADSVDK
jgi:hypothetical protein